MFAGYPISRLCFLAPTKLGVFEGLNHNSLDWVRTVPSTCLILSRQARTNQAHSSPGVEPVDG